MTRSEPHPQRCETCGHYQTRFEYGNKKICTLIKEKAPGSYQIGIPFHIDIVGCASHSSASEPLPENCPHWHCGTCNKSFGLIEEEARKEERERVLHALAKALEKRFEYVADYGLSEYEVLEVVDAQRQQEER